MGQGEVQWIRAAVGVSVRWVSLLPPSLLQPRVSSMGCGGIRYSLNMQPKTRSGVLLGNELAPWIGPVQLTSVGKKKHDQSYKIFSTAGGAKSFTFASLPPAKHKKVHPCNFWQRLWKWGRGRMRNPLCAVFKLSRRRSEEHLPNLCILLITRVESRREGEREKDRGRERVCE